MRIHVFDESKLTVQTREFYKNIISTLLDSGIPFLAGGAFALACYTQVVRDTKDFDAFIDPKNVRPILNVLEKAGYNTELTDDIWLAKAFLGQSYVDIVFASANAIAQVDDDWFKYSRKAKMLDLEVNLIPVEEMIWSKAFIMTRDRFDGADILHIILKHWDSIDYQRLLKRFADDWRVLYSYLILFGYVYPGEQDKIPLSLMRELAKRTHLESRSNHSYINICRGPLLSTTEFTMDVTKWGFVDPRFISSRV